MDLRDINDEQFKTKYSYIKNETKNFTELKPEFLKENPQYLLVIRTALGLSQLEFSKKLGTTNKQWVRHFEAGRQGHKWSKLFYPCVELINESFSKDQALKFEDALFHWIKSRAARKKFFLEDFKSKYKLKKISEMAIDDFKKYFGYLKKETQNFTDFDYKIIQKTPQFIGIFRIILDLGHRPFAKLFNENARTVRIHEYKEYKLMPETAEKYIKMIKKIFVQRNIVGKISLEQSLKNFKRISHYDHFENQIMQLLSERNIHYKIHESININNNKFNVDFLILKNKTPIAVIEASKMFSIRKEPTCRGRATRGIAYLDHRFQHIKKIYPKMLTIILLKTYPDKVDLIKRIAKREILNTDHVLINEEIKNLKDIL